MPAMAPSNLVQWPAQPANLENFFGLDVDDELYYHPKELERRFGWKRTTNPPGIVRPVISYPSGHPQLIRGLLSI
jgi:hypothetical protein